MSGGRKVASNTIFSIFPASLRMFPKFEFSREIAKCDPNSKPYFLFYLPNNILIFVRYSRSGNPNLPYAICPNLEFSRDNELTSIRNRI